MAAMASFAKPMGGAATLQTGMPGGAQLRLVRWTSGSRVGAGARSVARARLGEGITTLALETRIAEEIESKFGERVLGNTNTEHIIMVPALPVLRLSERAIEPVPEGAAPLTDAKAKALLRKVVGRRIVNQGSSDICTQCLSGSGFRRVCIAHNVFLDLGSDGCVWQLELSCNEQHQLQVTLNLCQRPKDAKSQPGVWPSLKLQRLLSPCSPSHKHSKLSSPGRNHQQSDSAALGLLVRNLT